MTVTINGTAHTLPDTATVVDALQAIGLAADTPGVAVALNLSVVRRPEWSSTALSEGAEVDVVTAAQGG